MNINEEKIYSRKNIRLKNNHFKINDKNKKILIFIIINIIAIITFMEITKIINPYINLICKNKAKSLVTNIINEEISLVMKKYEYKDLVSVIRDNNNIKMLQTNTKNINYILNQIPLKITRRIEKKEDSSLNIKLGTILGLPSMLNIGPNIKIKILHIGNIDSKLFSEFDVKGNNQTIHRLYIKINYHITILTPYDLIKDEIENQVLISESILIGNISN